MARRHVDDILEACNRVSMLMERLRGEVWAGGRAIGYQTKQSRNNSTSRICSIDFPGSIFMRQICSSSHEQCLRHAKKARLFELASCSSLLFGRGSRRVEAVTRDGRGTESGALRCLRVQVVKRKQISAKGGRDKGERGGITCRGG